MREYLFRGIRIDNGEWIEGFFHYSNRINPITRELIRTTYWILPIGGQDAYEVIPESIGEYTGMNEFVLTDATRNAKLFEGDIIEVWGHRHVRGYEKSQYDGSLKVRGGNCF